MYIYFQVTCFFQKCCSGCLHCDLKYYSTQCRRYSPKENSNRLIDVVALLTLIQSLKYQTKQAEIEQFERNSAVIQLQGSISDYSTSFINLAMKDLIVNKEFIYERIESISNDHRQKSERIYDKRSFFFLTLVSTFCQICLTLNKKKSLLSIDSMKI